MEARYNCCKAIHKSLMLSSKVSTDPALAAIGAKVRYQNLLLLFLHIQVSDQLGIWGTCVLCGVHPASYSRLIPTIGCARYHAYMPRDECQLVSS